MSWNPNAPDTLGLEWHATTKASEPLTSGTRAAAQRWTQDGDDTVNRFAVFLPQAAASRDGQGSAWELEVYKTSWLGDRGRTVYTYVPSADAVQTDVYMFQSATAEANDTYRGINSYPAALYPGKGVNPNNGDPIDNDEGIFPIFGSGFEASYFFPPAIEDMFTLMRIAKVTINCYAQCYVAYKQPAAMGIMPFLRIDNIRYDGAKRALQGQVPGGHLVSSSWDANPSTGVSWKPQDITKFSDQVAQASAGWVVDPTPNANITSMILQAWIEVEVTNDFNEPRVAVGTLRDPAPGWNVIDLTSPAGVPGFDRDDGDEYLWTLRRRTGEGRIHVRYLDSQDVSPAGLLACRPSFDAGLIMLDEGDDLTRLWAHAWVEADDSVTLDSTPYASASGDSEPVMSVDDDWTVVDVAHTLEQEITVPSSLDLHWVRLLAKVDPGTTEGLSVRLKTLADATLLGPLVFTPDQVGDPGVWTLLEGELAGATVTAAQRVLEFTSSAAAGKGWHVQVLSTFKQADSFVNAPDNLGDATFGGTTDAGTVLAGRFVEIDVAATIATQPPQVVDVVAALQDGDANISDVSVTWSPAVVSDGGGFLRYEVERKDERDDAWQRVANVTTADLEEFVDAEARAEVLNSYRVRVRRVDMSAGPWSSTVTATPVMSTCGYAFTSNVDHDIAVWADDERPRRMMWSQTVRHERMYGRDFRIGFHDLDWVGDAFNISLLLAADNGVNGTTATTTPGRRTFDPILRLLPAREAGLPYVCVRTSDGDRWYASLNVLEGREEQPSGWYWVDVEVVEVTNVPYPVEL